MKFFFREQEAERNTKIKDHIRDTCVTELVDSWFQILVGGNLVFWYNNEVEVSLTVFFIMFCMQKTYENSVSSITCLCLDIIGAYIEWIDIGLIANDRFIR